MSRFGEQLLYIAGRPVAATSGATFDGRPLRAGDIAIIVETHRDARACDAALAHAGIPAVYTGDSQTVFGAVARGNRWHDATDPRV